MKAGYVLSEIAEQDIDEIITYEKLADNPSPRKWGLESGTFNDE